MNWYLIIKQHPLIGERTQNQLRQVWRVVHLLRRECLHTQFGCLLRQNTQVQDVVQECQDAERAPGESQGEGGRKEEAPGTATPEAEAATKLQSDFRASEWYKHQKKNVVVNDQTFGAHKKQDKAQILETLKERRSSKTVNNIKTVSSSL